MNGVPGQLGVARGFNLEATPWAWGAMSLGATPVEEASKAMGIPGWTPAAG